MGALEIEGGVRGAGRHCQLVYFEDRRMVPSACRSVQKCSRARPFRSMYLMCALEIQTWRTLFCRHGTAQIAFFAFEINLEIFDALVGQSV